MVDNEIIALATRIVRQWDEHDKFRVTKLDELLWHFNEPDEVALARFILEKMKELNYGLV